LRAADELVELRADDLKFLPHEAAQFLVHTMDLSLPSDVINSLEARTEGWVAGLQLAALAMRASSKLSGSISDPVAFSGSHRYLLDYLADEVFDRQPDHVQRFLLRTSILDRLCGSLCDEVTSGPHSQALLEMLEHTNLFLVPLDDERRWFRYHHLFGEFLRNRLHQAEPDQVPELHRKASAWHEAHGLTAGAIMHSLEAADFERAARLVEVAAEPAIQRGEITTIRGWLEALPGEIIRKRYGLSIWYAWVTLLAGQVGVVESHLQAAENNVMRIQRNAPANRLPPGTLNQTLGQIAVIRAYLAQERGDLVGNQRYAREALELLKDGRDKDGRENMTLRSIALMSLGRAHLSSGDSAAAATSLSEAQEISRSDGLTYNTVGATYYLAQLRVAQGRLHGADALYEEMLRLSAGTGARDDTQPQLTASHAYAGMGELRYEWNELDEVARCLGQGVALAEPAGEYGLLRSMSISLARVKQVQGDSKGALELLDRADRLARETGACDQIARVAAWRARLCLAEGDMQAALRWSRELDEYTVWPAGRPLLPLLYRRGVEYTTLARLLIAQGRANEAASMLQAFCAEAEAAGWFGCVIELRALEALALQAQGCVSETFTALAQALSLAEPEGYVRTFLDDGAPMQELLSMHQQWQGTPGRGYAGRLLAAWSDAAARGAPGASATTLAGSYDEGSAEALTAREIEVLRLLADRLPYRIIAQKLIVTENTARWHIKNVYQKLQVNRRAQAIARAREHDLL